MPSPVSSTKPAAAGDEPLVPNVAGPRPLAPATFARSVEEIAEFLGDVEAVFGPDDEPRRPTIGTRFLL